MTPSEVTKILAQVSGGLYEEALDLSVDATRSEINRAHIRRVQRVKRMGKRVFERMRASSPRLVLGLAAGTVVIIGTLLFLFWG